MTPSISLTDSDNDKPRDQVEKAKGHLAKGHVVDEVGPGKAEENADKTPEG